MNRNLHRAAAWGLALLLVCQLVLPAAAAESDTIHIQSREDWDALVQHCRWTPGPRGKPSSWTRIWT